MWIHTNVPTRLLYAALPPDVDLMGYVGTLEQAGSRTHERKVRIHLGSDSATTPDGQKRRWSNSGVRGAGGYRAATYDEWGWFLAALFDADPTARCVNSYDGRADFHRVTHGKYRTRLDINVRISRIVKAYIAAMDEGNRARIGATCRVYWRLTEIRREKFPLPRTF